jgi:phenylacetate-CoA ligase
MGPEMTFPLSRRLYWRAKGIPNQPVLDGLMESQWWSPGRLAELRDAKLRVMIRHAWEHVPYYRRVMDERGLRPLDFRGQADLSKLPLLTKDLIREHAADLVAVNVPEAETKESRTGGSTGAPVHTRRWLKDLAWHQGSYWRGLSWGGLGVAAPRVHLFGGSLGRAVSMSLRRRVGDWLDRDNLFLPAFELGRHNVSDYARQIRDGGHEILTGYASAVYMLALLVREAGEELRLRTVFTTAESLQPSWRDAIEEVLGADVREYYGCGEVNSLGYQCGASPGYHRCDEHAIMEVLAEDGACAFEGEGAFVLTDLDNHAMPVLRYQNGDAGVLSDEPCACGRGLGRILRVDGRVSDFLITTRGDRISGSIAAHAFRHMDGVRFYQFVQDEPGQLEVRIVAGPGYDRAAREADFRRVFGEHLGADARLTIAYPEDIERTKAGKARFVINRCIERGGDRA